MIIFDHPRGGRFNFRVAGVAFANDRVLLQRVPEIDFWFLPGGRVEMLESAAEALEREMREELDAQVSVGRLLWVAENFFSMENRDFHELGLYFAMDVPARVVEAEEFAGFDPDVELEMRWFDLRNLPSVRPGFLREALLHPPESTAHIVFHDTPVPLT